MLFSMPQSNNANEWVNLTLNLAPARLSGRQVCENASPGWGLDFYCSLVPRVRFAVLVSAVLPLRGNGNTHLQNALAG